MGAHFAPPPKLIRVKRINMASIKTTDTTKILWIVLSSICNMYIITQLWEPCLHTVIPIKIHFLYQCLEQHSPNMLDI